VRCPALPWLDIVAFVGLLMIAGAHGEGARQMTLAGFVLTLGAAFMWAVSNLVARRAAQAGAYEPAPFIVWSSLVPIVHFLLLSAWVDGSIRMAQQLLTFDGRALFAVLYLALLVNQSGGWRRLRRQNAA